MRQYLPIFQITSNNFHHFGNKEIIFQIMIDHEEKEDTESVMKYLQ